MPRARLILLLAALAAITACRVHDVRTATIHVPAMKNEACADIVVKALSRAEGVRYDSFEVDFTNRIVRFDYDSMKLAMKNLEFIVAEAGFNANGIPADPSAAAKLPDDCR